MKKIYFMSGLPRSGSTLLSSILNQNPNIYSSTNSPIISAISFANMSICNSEQFRSNPKPECVESMLGCMAQNYYAPVNGNIIIDKSRSWTGSIDLIKKFITEDPKIICTVRNILDILLSFAVLHEKNGDDSMFNQILGLTEASTKNICEYLMMETSVVGASYSQLKKCFNSEYSKHLLLVEYEDLVNNPQDQLNGIYDFIGESRYEHDIDNITQAEVEDPEASVIGLNGLHHVRKSVGKIERDIHNYFDQSIINQYENMEFWRG